ncbi:hypothetical protein F7725_008637 [Dissostichus mawsoni]|uniref:Spectrin beta chain, non-erythrocytic 5 n=1 Tax=Dissostichus mawsoni TaxID=36200 RepID=A0A7J5Y7Q9_DISMA|nr:hypothetical protein F7725_008637 [Dissostichus mawsoni]
MEAELQAQESLYQGILGRGQDLLSKQSQANQRSIQKWISTLKKMWSHLTDEATARRNRLEAAAIIKQDHGKDESSTTALLQRHQRIEKEIRSIRRGTAEIQTTWLPDAQYQRDTVESTQAGLDKDYNSLYNLVKEFESWMEDKENVLNTFSSDADNLVVVQAKFENFLTELVSGRGQLDDIINMAEELVKSRHSKQREIQSTQTRVSNSTADVKSFLQSCEEAKVQLQGQLSGLGTVDLGCSSFTLLSEEKTQSQTLRDIQTLEAKIAYLKSVAKIARLQTDSGCWRRLGGCRASSRSPRSCSTGPNPSRSASFRTRRPPTLKEMEKLGKSLQEGSSNGKAGDVDVQQTLDKLRADWSRLDKLWANRKERLEQGVELQRLNQEGDRIEATLSGHEARLRVQDVGDSVDGVHSLLGRQEELEGLLKALDQRERSRSLQKANRKLKESSCQRRSLLLASKKYQEFQRDADELLLWIEEKFKVAEDESYRDPTNILRKLKKHEAAEKEMQANQVWLDTLVQLGQEMLSEEHSNSQSISRKSTQLSSRWRRLQDKMADRGDKLRQAGQQEQLMELLQAIQWMLNNAAKGHDLRSSRQLLKEHQQLEQDAKELAEKINSIVSRAKHLASNHFDSQRILKETETYLTLFKSLQKPLDRRRAQLEASVFLFGFYHDVDLELSWISEHELQAEVNAHRKHLNHVLEKGRSLAKSSKSDWDEVLQRYSCFISGLIMHAPECRVGGARGGLLLDCSELESRLTETLTLVNTDDYGKDELGTQSLLTKHKVEVEELGDQVEQAEQNWRLEELSRPYSRLRSLNQQLQHQAALRGLKEVLHLHEFIRECSESEDWMNEQRLTAESQDLGNDYQHIQQLEVGEERLQSCSDLAAGLILSKHPQSSAERRKSIPDDVAKDLRGVTSQLRKHEALLHELAATEQQLQEQLDGVDSILDLCSPQLKLRLQEVQQQLVERWEDLRLHAEKRDEELKLACQRYMFLNTAQDYFLWCNQLIGAMAAEETISDVVTSDLQLAQHQQLWAEMEARQETYQQALDMGEELQTQDRTNRKEVLEKLKALQEEREKLEDQWSLKQSWLESIHLEQVFYRDVNSMDKTSSSQEILLQNSTLGNTVDETEGLIKRHEAFEKLLSSQEDKLSSLKELSERLKKQLSREKSSSVQTKLKALLKRRDRIKELSVKRREEWSSPGCCAEEWVSERMQKMAEDGKADLSYLQAKMKLLQKHQVFEAEILAHREIIGSVLQAGEELVSLRHPRSKEVKRSSSALQLHWEELKKALASRGKSLEDNRDFLEFLQKEVMINVGDVGKDYEHGVQLLKKLSEFRGTGDGDVTVDDAHITAINRLADRLEKRQSAEELVTVRQRRKQLNDRWSKFHGDLSNYKKKLEGALVNLIRRHEETEREAGVIQERSKRLYSLPSLFTQALEMEVSDHLKARSVMSDKLKSKQKEVQKALKTLDQELFKANQRLLLEWSVKQSGEMAEKGLPKTRAEAERLIVEHQDWKRIDSVRDFGLGLIRSGHGLKAEIQKALNQLEEAKSGLDRAWLNRNTALEQARTLQVFLSSVDQCESWLSNKEAGNTLSLRRRWRLREQLDEVETLGQKMIQQKHYDSDNIRGKTKALAARRSQLQQQSRTRHKALDRSLKLQQFLSSSYQRADGQLGRSDHNNCKEKKTRLQEAYQRSLDDMEQSVGSVESELNNEDCGSDLPSVTRLLQALQGLEEEVDGLRDRIQGLVDTAKSFHSQGNFLAEEIQTRVAHTINRYNGLSEPLLSRRETLEAWQAVTQEISSRAPLVQAVQEAGHSLVRGRHFASHDIRERLKELKRLHEDLLTEAERKGKLLQEALSIHTFLTEEQQVSLESRESGRSEEATETLLRKLDSVDVELENQRRTVEKLQESGAPLVSEALPGVAERFETLLRLSTSRRSALEDQLRLYVFEREAKELQTWLTSKKTLVLQKKLEVLVSETSGLGRTRLTSVQQLSRGLQTDSSARRRDDALSYLWEELNSSIRAREQSLQAAREVHQFNHDVDELKGWMGEKEAVLEAEDQEHDLHSIQTLLRQHEALERDLALISEEVRKSKDEGRALSRRQPSVRSAVTQRLEELEVFWRNVQEKASQRRARLGQAEDVQKYLSLCSELMAWLREMLSLVRSEALSVEGNDLEHLIKKHEEYRVQIDRQLSKSLAELEEKVVKVWEETRILYEEELEICLLQRELEQAERWLSSYENTLMAEDYGYDSVSDVMELLKRQEDLEAMIQAQSERFIALQKKKTQDRKPAARVSSLRSKPSDPKTPRTSRDIVRRVSSGRKTDRNIRSPIQDKKTSVKTSASPPPSPPPHRDTRRYSSRRTWEVEEEEAPPPTPTVRTWRSRSSQSPDSSSPKPPPPPPSSSKLCLFEERRPIFKPLLAPKPRISSEERTLGLRSEKLATPPDSPPPIRGLVAPTQPPPPPPPVAETPSSPDSSPSPTRKELQSEPGPPDSPSSATPPDSPTPPPITEEETESADLSPPMRELPPSPSQRQRKLEDLPEEEHGSTQEVTAERPIRMEGMLEIKLKQGGNKMASRWPPINMNGVVCRENAYYRRKENTFKLILEDSSQFLFAASSRDLLLLWVKKLQNCPESDNSDSDDSGRASSVNLSLEKLADAQEDSSSNKHLDRRAESLERQSSTESQPHPNPPHLLRQTPLPEEGGQDRTAGSSSSSSLCAASLTFHAFCFIIEAVLVLCEFMFLCERCLLMLSTDSLKIQHPFKTAASRFGTKHVTVA